MDIILPLQPPSTTYLNTLTHDVDVSSVIYFLKKELFSSLSPTLLLLGLPWLTGTGDFLSRG